jgi:hypothetical protein
MFRTGSVIFATMATSEDEPMASNEILEMLNSKLAVRLWPEAGKALGLSRDQTYRAARKKKIEVIDLGRGMVATSWLKRKLGLDEAGSKAA